MDHSRGNFETLPGIGQELTANDGMVGCVPGKIIEGILRQAETP
jgi:hypothetical protein